MAWCWKSTASSQPRLFILLLSIRCCNYHSILYPRMLQQFFFILFIWSIIHDRFTSCVFYNASYIFIFSLFKYRCMIVGENSITLLAAHSLLTCINTQPLLHERYTRQSTRLKELFLFFYFFFIFSVSRSWLLLRVVAACPMGFRTIYRPFALSIPFVRFGERERTKRERKNVEMVHAERY